MAQAVVEVRYRNEHPGRLSAMLHVVKIFIFIFIFLMKLASSASVLLNTFLPEMPIVLINFPNIGSTLEIHQTVDEFYSVGNYTRQALDDFLHRFLTRFHGSSIFTDINAIFNHIPPQVIVSAFTGSANMGSNGVGEFESRHPRDIEDWKRSATVSSPNTLPVKVRRSSIISDAVQSYKDFDRIPYTMYLHLFNRNLEVTFVDEAGQDLGGLRNEFFTVFFHEIIESSGLFTLNSEGYLIIAPDRTFPEDLDVYEAFGFYLGKAFQNNIPVGCQFAKIIIQMIKYGRISFESLDLLESWDPELTSSLRLLTKFTSEALSSFNFNDIDPNIPSIPLNNLNVGFYNALKMQKEINSKFQVQLLMIVLGFARACPCHLLARYSVDLAAAFMGNKSLTAEDLISALAIQGPFSSITAYYWFSQWLRSLNQSQLMNFFRFLTGMKVLPPGNLSDLKLKIVFAPAGTEHKIPQANTCRRTFILPPYSTEEEAMARLNILLQHIESGEAFGFGFA